MTTVIEFESNRKNRPVRKTVVDGPAQILIFNGVRFERLETIEIDEHQTPEHTKRRERAV